MTALLSIDTASGAMRVYVPGMNGKPHCNATSFHSKADWDAHRDDLDFNALNQFRRENSQPHVAKVNPNDPGTGGTPAAMRAAA